MKNGGDNMKIKNFFKYIWLFIKNFYDVIVIILGVFTLLGITISSVVTFFYENNIIIFSLIIILLLIIFLAYYIRYKLLTIKAKNLKNLESENEKLKEDISKYQNFFSLEAIEKMADIGIIDCTLKLNDTDFAPTNCMERIKRKLLFSGVSGAKWVQDPVTQKKFRKMLDKISNNNGEVKFLLIDPNSKAYEKLKKQREGDISNASYPIWKQLVSEYDCLQVRCYNHLPSFRIQLMDDTTAAISRYQIRKEDYDKFKQGWDNPHLIIKSEGIMSFFPIYEKEFLKEWESATEISKIEIMEEK